MKTTATKQDVLQAIENVNKEHGYKIELNRSDQIGKWFNFTIKSPSKVPGARTSATGRNLAAASWHAHGYIMDEIFNLSPDSVIVSMGVKYRKGFEWTDRNVGSYFNPVYMSETSIL